MLDDGRGMKMARLAEMLQVHPVARHPLWQAG